MALADHVVKGLYFAMTGGPEVCVFLHVISFCSDLDAPSEGTGKFHFKSTEKNNNRISHREDLNIEEVNTLSNLLGKTKELK